MPGLVLVLGGGGFLGRATARALAQGGYDVCVPLRPGRELPPELRDRVVPVYVSSSDAALAGTLQTVEPSAVVDAAWSGVAGASRADAALQAANVARVATLLDALDPAVTRTWVGLGSQAEYGVIDGRVSESHPLRATTPYGRAKLEVERMLRERAASSGVRVAWLRVFASYGPGQGPGWLIPDTVMRMLVDEPVPLTTGRQGCDYLYVDDVAHAVRLLLETETAAGVYNVGSGHPVAVRDLVSAAREAADSSSKLLMGALPDPPGPVTAWAADTSRLRRDTGWMPRTTLRAGLRDTVAWLRDRDERPHG